MNERTNAAAAPRADRIVLTGMMGTGKTAAARLLAELLGWEVFDTDEIITERHGEIAEIFANLGEARFRKIEADLAVELAGVEKAVISSGGGMLLGETNARALGAEPAATDAGDEPVSSGRTRAFCLTATAEEIVRRLSEAASAEPGSGEAASAGDRAIRPLLEAPSDEVPSDEAPSDEALTQRVRALLEERAAAYARFEQVDTTGLTPLQVAEEIHARLG